MDAWFGARPLVSTESNALAPSRSSPLVHRADDAGSQSAQRAGVSAGAASGPRWSTSARVPMGRAARTPTSFSDARDLGSRRTSTGASASGSAFIEHRHDASAATPVIHERPVAHSATYDLTYDSHNTAIVAASTNAAQRVSNDTSSRGRCGVCGLDVLSSQRRVRDASGVYYHQGCNAVRASTSSAASVLGGVGDEDAAVVDVSSAAMRVSMRQETRCADAHGEDGAVVSDERGGGALGALPDELLVGVLRFLTHRELLVVGGVCRLLRRVAADRVLWASADLTGCRLGNGALAEVGRRASEAVTLARCSGVDARGMSALLTVCAATIRSLDLGCCRIVTGASRLRT
jgi:hypothetical protein